MVCDGVGGGEWGSNVFDFPTPYSPLEALRLQTGRSQTSTGSEYPILKMAVSVSSLTPAFLMGLAFGLDIT